jgi:hypothetical protein
VDQSSYRAELETLPNKELYTLIVAAGESTVAMCRAKRSAQPLDDVALQLGALINDAIKP